jgi:hypothetical protein
VDPLLILSMNETKNSKKEYKKVKKEIENKEFYFCLHVVTLGNNVVSVFIVLAISGP